ncbi:hypothetical protein [Mycobacterium sp. NPDC050853]|uniref:hypothetical protein n=1 Tax=Mycobacterium sp. NPDC050853 TaxID=3155160 RepID=UPI0033E14A1F
MISFPTWDYLPPGWGFVPAANVAVLVCLTPLMVYRVWRWWHRRSSPAAAATALTVAMLWLQMALAWGWDMLPPVVKAVEISGGPGVMLLSVLQLIVMSLRGTSRARFGRDAWTVAAAAACVLAVMTVVVVMGGATSVDLRPYRFNLSPELTNPGLAAATVIANIYMAAILVQMVRLGVRRANNTPAGWGLGLLATAAAACLVSVVHGGILNHTGVVVAPHSMWLTVVPSGVCAICVLAGLTTPPLMLYWQARRKLFLLNQIRQHLITVFPALDAPLAPGASRTDVVHEWCSQIQDGLTLTAQQYHTPLQGDEPSAVLSERADAVARWLTGVVEPNLNCQWLTTPEAVTGQDWMLAVAAAYRRYASGAGLSGSPSAVRR